MNQKIFNGLTATLLVSVLGFTTTSPGVATQPEAFDQPSEANFEAESNKPFTQSIEKSASTDKLASTKAPGSSTEALKIGEQKSPTSSNPSKEAIAKVYSHNLSGRQAATLYVRNIPVLTFIGSPEATVPEVKIGTQQTSGSSKSLTSTTVSNSLSGTEAVSAAGSTQATDATNSNTPTNDPVWRASELAAKLNQLNREGVDASKITVTWDTGAKMTSDRYMIKVNQTILATVDATTLLPDSTNNLESDALQATNRLRRLMGNAAPLDNVSGKSTNAVQQIAVGPMRFQVQGWASWYGPGFDGNQSASGETFNQNALTAAHRTLPFGTQVRVTNLDNGQSVVVRINDRGPYHGDRIIDLSAGAARILGLISSGVAPVRLDVLNERLTSR